MANDSFRRSDTMQAMMPAQARNVSEAGLRPPPSTSEFLARLADAQAPRPPPADVALFGGTFATAATHKPGTRRAHSQSCRAAIEFEQVCKHRGVDFPGLDDWLVAFAKWTLHPKFLLDGTDEIASAIQQREEFARGANVPVKGWSATTLKTMVNSLAHLYKQTQPPIGIVPSAEQQFPQFCLTFNGWPALCEVL